jgi:Protein of unknown function (DUF2550)
MLIALLAILGVDLIVIVILAALVIGRRYWLKRQAGWFPGAVRVTSGDVHGLSPKWKRGSGRWVRDILVWSKAPFFYRDELVPVDGISGERTALAGEVKRLGDAPVITFASGTATIEVAAKAELRDRVIGSLTAPATGTPVSAPD